MSGTQVWNKTAEFPRNQAVLTPDDEELLPQEMVIVAGSDGDVSITNYAGTTVVWSVLAGQAVPCRALRVNATGTTASPIIGVW